MLYFIQSGTKIKIGRGNPFARYKAISTASPDPCKLLLAIHVSNEVEAERVMHNHFREFRVNGEWFEINFSAAFEALKQLKLIPEHEQPLLDIPVVPTIDPDFERWFRATCKTNENYRWEDPNNLAKPIDFYWHECYRTFLAEREKHGNIDAMIYAGSPVSLDDSYSFIKGLRAKLAEDENGT